MSKPLTPDCPLCSHPPKFIVGITQAFCGNDACSLLCWDPTLTLDENLLHAGVARWEPTRRTAVMSEPAPSEHPGWDVRDDITAFYRALTAGQVTEGIANAIKAHDFKAAITLLKVLAVSRTPVRLRWFTGR